MNIEEVLSNKAFKNIEPERIKAFSELSEKLQGKNLNQSIEIILEFSKNMPKGREITDEERRAMMEAVLCHMPENDRSNFKAMMKMLELMDK